MTKKILKYLGLIFLGLIVVAIAIVIIDEIRFDQYHLKKCKYYNPEWIFFVDCYGVMSLHEGDSGWANYIWQDDEDPSVNIATMDKKDQYIVQGNNLYIINHYPPHDFDESTKRYKVLFKMNGSYQEFSYSSKDEIPTLLVFNTNTANVRPYVKIEEVPSEEQKYFIELQKR
jgi:hypothetical protein